MERVFALALSSCLLAPGARANSGMALQYTQDTWPLSIVDRPLVVAPGMTEIQLNIDQDLSTAAVTGNVHPLTAQLLARYGVSDRIHAVIDSIGFCFSDCGNAGFFQHISGYVGYAWVANQEMNLVPQIGLALSKVDQLTSSALLAAVQPSLEFGWRLTSWLQIFSYAALSLGFAGRDNTPTPDTLALHLEPRIELLPRVTLAPFIGLVQPLAHTQFYQLPAGLGLYFVADRAVDLGAAFKFTDIAKRTIVTPSNSADQGGIGGRSITCFVTVRL